ncbi:MAG: hypothetical protein ACOX24_00510 [Christensenellales bacterium]|jgi:hypothetical protein
MKNKKRIITLIAFALMITVLTVALAACNGPHTVDDGIKKMGEKGYTCITREHDGTAGFFAEKDAEEIFAIMYKNYSTAEKKVEEYNKQSIKPLGEAKQIGKWMVFGTHKAIKDFR